MRLTEMDGKALLRRHGIAVPRSVVLGASDPVPLHLGAEVVLKAQILEGGRGKRGLVRRAAAADIPALSQDMIAITGEVSFLLEEPVQIERELYLALRVNGTTQRIECLFSTDGGVEIEQAAPPARWDLDPEDPFATEVSFAAVAAALPPDLAARVARLVPRLAHILREEDLELLELNPLAVTPAGLVACDAKLVRDSAAVARHDALPVSAALEEAALTPLERQARQRGFALVEMPGDVALVSAGAGLGMQLLDLLADHGLRAASFMDNLQGGPADTTEARLEAAFAIAARPEVRAILFYTTLASRPLAERVETLLAFLARNPPPKPSMSASPPPMPPRGASTLKRRGAG
ncbi:ATP-grasp domain-containing protein [Pseudoroseomonas wenyumeiae]